MNMQRMLTTFLILSFGLTASIAQAQTGIFLSFPDTDIVGESVNQNHVDEVEIVSFSWDVVTEAGKKSETNVDISEFSLIKFVDSSTASVLTKAVMGENLGRVVMKIHRPSGAEGSAMHVDYLILTLHDATIASVSSSLDGGEDRITEQIVLTFSSITGVYTPINKDGSLRSPFEFDIAANGII